MEDFTACVSANLQVFTRKAYQILGNWADAEDAVQDAMYTAYRSLKRFRGDCKMSTWLMSCVINASLMKLRSRKETIDFYVFANDLVDSIDSPEIKASVSERHALALEAIAKLSPALRRSIELRDFRDMKYSDMASLTGLTVGAMKSARSRALMQLREALAWN
jgi:RNA polymerase sigma-70 factor, ECF subfamily